MAHALLVYEHDTGHQLRHLEDHWIDMGVVPYTTTQLNDHQIFLSTDTRQNCHTFQHWIIANWNKQRWAPASSSADG